MSFVFLQLSVLLLIIVLFSSFFCNFSRGGDRTKNHQIKGEMSGSSPSAISLDCGRNCWLCHPTTEQSCTVWSVPADVHHHSAVSVSSLENWTHCLEVEEVSNRTVKGKHPFNSSLCTITSSVFHHPQFSDLYTDKSPPDLPACWIKSNVLMRAVCSFRVK